MHGRTLREAYMRDRHRYAVASGRKKRARELWPVRGPGAEKVPFALGRLIRQPRSDRLGSAPDPCGRCATAWCDATRLMVARNAPHRVPVAWAKEWVGTKTASEGRIKPQCLAEAYPSNRTATAFFVAPQHAS